jgi:hypothetical protein
MASSLSDSMIQCSMSDSLSRLSKRADPAAVQMHIEHLAIIRSKAAFWGQGPQQPGEAAGSICIPVPQQDASQLQEV